MTRRTCEAVTSPSCTNPPGSQYDEYPPLRATCYRCGLPACRECSSVRVTRHPRGQRIRICDNCLQDEPDGEAKVLLRRYREAGYPLVTLAMCHAEITAATAYVGRFA